MMHLRKHNFGSFSQKGDFISDIFSLLNIPSVSHCPPTVYPTYIIDLLFNIDLDFTVIVFFAE